MTTLIEGADCAHWQGKITAEIASKMYAAGIRFVWVKFSQGARYRDPLAVENTRALQSVGILVGPYHFTTNDGSQYANFSAATEGIQFQLSPMQDCEAYTSVNGKDYGLEDLRQTLLAPQGQAYCLDQLEMKPATFRTLQLSAKNNLTFAWAVRAAYGLTTPNEKTVELIGNQMLVWMRNQPALAIFPQPAVYTNPYWGNVIFRNTANNRFLLDVAHWGATTPSKPTIWKNVPELAWQDYVIKDATKYGLPGTALDHQQWRNMSLWPGNVTPAPERVIVTVQYDGSPEVYQGLLNRKRT